MERVLLPAANPGIALTLWNSSWGHQSTITVMSISVAFLLIRHAGLTNDTNCTIWPWWTHSCEFIDFDIRVQSVAGECVFDIFEPFCWLHWEEIFHSLRQILLRWRKRSWSVADWPASLLPTPCWSAVARWSWWTSLPSAVEIPPRQPAASTVQRHRPRRPRRLRRLAVLVASCDLFFVMSCACHLSMFRSNAAQECTRMHKKSLML